MAASARREVDDVQAVFIVGHDAHDHTAFVGTDQRVRHRLGVEFEDRRVDTLLRAIDGSDQRVFNGRVLEVFRVA